MPLQDVCKALERIACLAETASDEAALKVELQALRNIVSPKVELKELKNELKIWQDKLSVILKEPIGRKGMAKHARFWTEKLGDRR